MVIMDFYAFETTRIPSADGIILATNTLILFFKDSRQKYGLKIRVDLNMQ